MAKALQHNVTKHGVSMLNYIREKHIFVCIEFDPIEADHGCITGISALTRY